MFAAKNSKSMQDIKMSDSGFQQNNNNMSDSSLQKNSNNIKDINISENGINMVIRIMDDGAVKLLHCSNLTFDETLIRNRNLKNEPCALSRPNEEEIASKNILVMNMVEVAITGGDYNDHHGAKKTRTSEGSTLRFTKISDTRNKDGRQIVMFLKNQNMIVECTFQFYDGISVLHTFTRVKALKKIALEYVSTFNLIGVSLNNYNRVYDELIVGIPHNAWHGEGQWRFYTLSDLGMTACHDEFYMKKISYGNTGSWSSKEFLPQGILHDKNSNIMWQIENNGSWYNEIGNLRGMIYFALSGPTFADNHWVKPLDVGESFTSVSAALAFTNSKEKSIEEMVKYRRKIVRKNYNDRNLPTQYNDYMHANWAEPTPERLVRQIESASRIGVEYFVIDAGWYSDGYWWATLGEWKEAPRRFGEKSLKQVYDLIRKNGMKGGIWLEIESVGKECSIADELSDLIMTRFKKKILDHERYFLDFSLKKTRDYATGVIDRLVADYGIEYVKMDYNVDCGVGCDNNAFSFGDGLLTHNRAYLKWIEDMQDRHPKLIIEACASGGNRLDYATMKYHSLGSMSDQIYYNRNPYILNNLLATLIPEQTGAWCYPRKNESYEQAVINLVNATLFRLQLSGEIEQLSSDILSLIKESNFYHRKIKDLKLKALPYMPLGFCKFFDKTIAFGLKTEELLILCVYNLGGDRQKTIPLKGVSAKFAQISFPKNNNTKYNLTKEGLKLEFESDECARVFEIKL